MGEVCRGGLERDSVARAVSDSTPERAGPEEWERESQSQSSRLRFLLITMSWLTSLCSLTDHIRMHQWRMWSPPQVGSRSDRTLGRCEARWTIGATFSVSSAKRMDTLQSIVPKAEQSMRARSKPALIVCSNPREMLALREGYLEWKPVQILVDSGSEITVVKASLTDPKRWNREELVRVHGNEILYPSAQFRLETDGGGRTMKVALIPEVPVDILLGVRDSIWRSIRCSSNWSSTVEGLAADWLNTAMNLGAGNISCCHLYNLTRLYFTGWVWSTGSGGLKQEMIEIWEHAHSMCCPGSFHWPCVFRDVSNYCKTCEVCQKGQGWRCIRQAEMIPMPLIHWPFQRIAMDGIGPLPRTRSGHKYILLCNMLPWGNCTLKYRGRESGKGVSDTLLQGWHSWWNTLGLYVCLTPRAIQNAQHLSDQNHPISPSNWWVGRAIPLKTMLNSSHPGIREIGMNISSFPRGKLLRSPQGFPPSSYFMEGMWGVPLMSSKRCGLERRLRRPAAHLI